MRIEPMLMGVTGVSPAASPAVVEVVLDECPLCASLWDYGRRVLALSIFISMMTAALVYASLQWLAGRPLKRLTAAMTAFRRDPSDPRHIIAPESRGDEFGVAESALADMQRRIRQL